MQASAVYRSLDKQLHRKTTRRRAVRYGILGINALLLLGVLAFVLLSRPDSVASIAPAITSSGEARTDINPLDQVSSSDIAVNVSRMSGMLETVSVTNRADSVNAELSQLPAAPSIVSKPQVVATALKSRKDIQTYVTLPGDTVSSIATKFGVTSDSIRWSNNISASTIAAGTSLFIPPGPSGIVYTVKAGDTPDTLSTKFKASKDEIVAANDAEISGLKVGERVLIPSGTQPAPPAPVVRAASAAWGVTPVYGFNGYDFGYCTWYVANRRAELGRPVPANLGDAYTWVSRAASAGIPTGTSPKPGAVAMKHSGAPGHVAVVELVNGDGSFWVSEMNSGGQRSMTDPTPAGGWGKIDWKLIPASSVGNWGYIY